MKVTSTQRPLTERELLALAYLDRYRYRDTPHLFALIECGNRNAYYTIERLLNFGLIAQLPSPTFQRNSIGAPRIYEATDRGRELLSNGGRLPRATLLKAGRYKEPLHNLNLCLATASFELACRAAGWGFYPWGEIETRTPGASHSFELTDGGKLHRVHPDNIFTIETPDDFACIALELDITNHGAAEYRQKFKLYEQIIYTGLYKRQLGMTQRFYVLTISTNDAHTKNLMPCLPKRAAPFLFKTISEYGRFQKAPPPALAILDGWFRADLRPRNLGDAIGHTADTRTTGQARRA